MQATWYDAISKFCLRPLVMLLGLVTLLFYTAAPSIAAPAHQLTDGVTLDWHIGGTINAITPVSNTLYVGSGPDLLILDITNPVTPTRLGSLTLDNPLREIDVAGDYAYIAAGNHGAYIVDISDKTVPKLVTTVEVYSEVHSIALFDHYAFLAYRDLVPTPPDNLLSVHTGVAVLDIANPAAFTIINDQIDGLTFDPYALEIADGQLFVAGGAFEAIGLSFQTWGRLQAFVLTDPTTPAPLPPFSTDANANEIFYALKINNGIAYVAQENGVVALSIATPTAITVTLKVPLSALTVSSLAVKGDQLYIARDYTSVEPGLYQFAIGTPLTLTQQGFYAHAVTATALQGDYAFIGSKEKGLEIWSLTNGGPPKPVGSYANFPTTVSGLTAQGNYVYLTRGSASTSSLTTVETRGVQPPTVTNTSLLTAHYATNPLQDGRWLYVFDRITEPFTADGIELFDLTNPAVPQWRVRHATGAIDQALLLDHQLYLVAGSAAGTTVRIFDATNPLTLNQIGSFTLPGVDTLTIRDKTLFYISSESPINDNYNQRYLYIADITSLNMPQPLSRLLLPWLPTKLVATPAHLYLTGYSASEDCLGMFGSVDLTQLTAPHLLGTRCWRTFPADLAVKGQLAYVTLQDEGLRVVDSAVAHAPAEISYPFRGEEYPYVAVVTNTIYVSGEGLFALHQQPPTATKLFAGADTLVAPPDGITYTFPAGTFTGPVTVTHTIRAVDPWRAFAADQLGIGTAFALTAVGSADGAALQPVQPFTLTVTYTDAAIGLVDETTLVLYRWTGNAWVVESGSQVDPANNRVTATPSQTGLWMLAATVPGRLYLPVMLR